MKTPTIYFVSGMGAGAEIFKPLQSKIQAKWIHIPWEIPLKNESLNAYTKRLTQTIDQTEPFILIGLSFGGIIVQEMHQYIQPQTTILLSSAQSRADYAWYIKQSYYTQIHRILPIKSLVSSGVFSYKNFSKHILGIPSQKPYDNFFTQKDPYYIQWAINEVIHWKGINNLNNIYQIQGSKDLVFPPSKSKKNYYTVDGGTHLMIYTKVTKVATIIQKILEEID